MPTSVNGIPLGQDDLVYNISAKMLSPIVTRAERHAVLLAGELSRHGQHPEAWMEKSGANKLVHFTTDMIYGHSVTVPQDRGPSGQAARRIWREQARHRDAGPDLSRQGLPDPDLPAAPDHRAGPSGHSGQAVQADRHEPAGADDRFGQEPLPVHLGVRLRQRLRRLAWKADFPNSAYNLGSDDPPPVKKLLGDLIKHAGSKSILLPTPAFAGQADAERARLRSTCRSWIPSST
jgi:dTDP-glucose 4,6-dehydratase